MTTTISQVDNRSIEYGVLIDLTLDGTTYYISNCYKEVIYGGHTYQALAGFLTISEIQSNISNANDEVQVSLSAIPAGYISAVLGQPIKGGDVNIYRAFFDTSTGFYNPTQVYLRFSGYVSNYSLNENWDQQSKLVSNTIGIQ
jgi:mannose-6-phosphate isomerase class I